MAELIGGIASSHVPSIGAAIDHERTQEPYWKALFDGIHPTRDWISQVKPDVVIVVYNDHASRFGLDVTPTFAGSSSFRVEIGGIATTWWWGPVELVGSRRPVGGRVGNPQGLSIRPSTGERLWRSVGKPAPAGLPINPRGDVWHGRRHGDSGPWSN